MVAAGAIAAGVGAAATIAGGIGNQRPDHTYNKKAVDRLKGARSVLEDQFGMSYEQFQDALASFQEGFPGVMQEITSMGDLSRQEAKDQYQQRVGEGGQNLVSRGLGNTTVRSNFESGESSRYMRNLGAINEGLASVRSGVMLQGLGMQSSLMQQLGGVNERFAAGYSNLTQSMANADLSAPTQAGMSPGELAAMGQGFGQLAGMFGSPGTGSTVKNGPASSESMF